MKKLIVVLLFLVFIHVAVAQEGRMPLLAVKQTDNGQEGSAAELILEIKEGSGRVFVDTFPLSKIDTQISMRFAKEISCDFIDYDCDELDFVYTIRADSPIIGGPSAGAAASVLTISVLTDSPLRKRIALTGTINSGGLIGPVGGLKEKIDAAADSDLQTVLIPMGETNVINKSDNTSQTLAYYGADLNIEVIEVSELGEALKIFTGKDFVIFDKSIVISDFYTNIMKGLSEQLCKRNEELSSMLIIENRSSNSLYTEAINLSTKAEIANSNGEYYSGASFCFGSNVKLNQVFLETKNFSIRKYRSLLNELKREINDFEEEIEEREIKTITDLESYMIVKERLREAYKFTNSTNESLVYSYAYGNERLRSAHSWAQFLNNKGRDLKLDQESLQESCRQRLAEAEERLQYASIYLPFRLSSSKGNLERAYEDFNNEDYALCLFKASKSKAEANIVLNTMGIEDEFIPDLIENKLDAATRVIVKAESKEIFPVLGYSYYEYANSLKETDKFSALLYAEYALELSNLDIYFKEEEFPKIDFELDSGSFLIIGIVIGIAIGLVIRKPSKTRALLGKKR